MALAKAAQKKEPKKAHQKRGTDAQLQESPHLGFVDEIIHYGPSRHQNNGKDARKRGSVDLVPPVLLGKGLLEGGVVHFLFPGFANFQKDVAARWLRLRINRAAFGQAISQSG